MVIKFFGVEYDVMIVDDMVVVEIVSGKVVEGSKKFFFDMLMYLVFYCCYVEIGGIVYIYLCYVIIWLQVGLDFFVWGIIYVDYFYGVIFCM